MNKTDFFEMLTTIVDHKTFKYDTDKQLVSIQLPLNWETIIDFKKTVLSFLGNIHTPERNWEQDPAHWGYKFDAHYLDIDEKTIKINEKGRLYVDSTELVDSGPFIDKLLENETALQKIADKILEKLVVQVPIPTQTAPPQYIRPRHHDPHHDHDDPDQP